MVWLTVEGRGNFQNSAELKSLVRQGIEEGASRIVLDLERCSGMDSTFMGMLSCVAVKLEDAGGALHVVNAAGKNGELLRGLGLDEVFAVEDGMKLPQEDSPATGEGEEKPAVLSTVPRTPCNRQDQRAICLEAHEALAGIKDANAEKFRDVIQLMRQDKEPAQVAH